MQPKILNSTLFLARRRFFITFSLSGIVKMRMSPTLKSATLSTRSSADCYTHIQCCCCWDKCLSSCAETQSLRRAKRSRAPINFAKKNDSLSSFALSHVCVDLMFFNFFSVGRERCDAMSWKFEFCFFHSFRYLVLADVTQQLAMRWWKMLLKCFRMHQINYRLNHTRWLRDDVTMIQSPYQNRVSYWIRWCFFFFRLFVVVRTSFQSVEHVWNFICYFCTFACCSDFYVLACVSLLLTLRFLNFKW